MIIWNLIEISTICLVSKSCDMVHAAVFQKTDEVRLNLR
jgi:hypothetical protein